MSLDASMQRCDDLILGDPSLLVAVRFDRACVQLRGSLSPNRPPEWLNERSDGPVPRPSSRLGMLIVSRADRNAIRRRAAERDRV